MNAIDLAIIMFLLILVGYVCRKTKMVDEHFGKGLANFVFNIVFPAVIINSMNISFDQNDLRNSLILVLISAGTMVVMFFLAKLINLATGKSDSLSRIITFGLMFPNFTFMAYPVMETLFPEKGLFYISMYTISTRIAIYILGSLIMKPKNKAVSRTGLVKEGFRSLLTPPVLAIPVGLFLYFTGITLPVPIQETLTYLARTATPLGMVVSGIIIAEVPLKNLFGEARLYLLTFLRLIVVPVLVFFLLTPLRLDPIILKISVLFCALPVASSTSIFAVRFKADSTNAAGSVFLTTVFSIITVPICAYILELVV